MTIPEVPEQETVQPPVTVPEETEGIGGEETVEVAEGTEGEPEPSVISEEDVVISEEEKDNELVAKDKGEKSRK